MAKKKTSVIETIDPEWLLDLQIKDASLPMAERQFKFHPKRRWRADFGWKEQKIIAEVEGGIYIHGRHVRPAGFTRDAIKYNTATLMGYKVFRFTSDMVRDGSAIDMLIKVFEGVYNDKKKKS